MDLKLVGQLKETDLFPSADRKEVKQRRADREKRFEIDYAKEIAFAEKLAREWQATGKYVNGAELVREIRFKFHCSLAVGIMLLGYIRRKLKVK